ncbi:hypothetical protein [Lysobacter gummosus]|uniref:hypothetical protein n=1 Tax=Lysobacter gummosus TaxID=262324 RepID=UPI003637031D
MTKYFRSNRSTRMRWGCQRVIGVRRSLRAAMRRSASSMPCGARSCSTSATPVATTPPIRSC